MVVEHIHIVQLHAAQALVQPCDEVLAAAPVAIWPRPHQVPGLGGNEHFIAVAGKFLLQQAAEAFLRAAGGRAVIIRQVKVADTQLQRTPDDGCILRPVIAAAEIVPKPQ